MKRPATKIVGAAIGGALVIIVFSAVRMAMRAEDDVPCGAGFARKGVRCLAATAACPAALVSTPKGCDEPERSVVEVPETSVLIGPSDWEAEGRVRARTVKTAPFAIDRFEVSRGRFAPGSEDPGRAASGVTLGEARAFCKDHGGRLPTEDEWIAAAAGDKPRRYPWGDTGAVCRRAAWGLTRGPCGQGATGPDTVGAHPDGATPLGIHDLAGNVAEWVEPVATESAAVVRGGSYDTDLATDLRTWVRREVSAASRDPSIGFRCAYEPVESVPPQ